MMSKENLLKFTLALYLFLPLAPLPADNSLTGLQEITNTSFQKDKGKNKDTDKKKKSPVPSPAPAPTPTPTSTPTPAPAGSIFDITAYGISSNSTADAVPAILKAAKAAQAYVKANKKPAEIFIPTGKYSISQFQLQDLNNITLHLGPNAELNALAKNSSIDNSKPYISIDSCSTFVFYGETGSLFDGNGESWWSGSGSRPYLMTLSNCTDYQMYGLALNNSPSHTLTLSKCKNGVIHDLSIVSPATSPNTDGIDPMSDIDGLEIYNCYISNGDDGIAINSSGPMNNIYIHNCQLVNGHGMSIGSNIQEDITNVRIEDLDIDGAWYAIRLKFAYCEKTAHLKNISYTNINAKNISRAAILITNAYNGEKANTKVTLEDISINNFVCTDAPMALSLSMNNKEQVITPLVLNNVSITGTTKPNKIDNFPTTTEN